MFKKVSIVKKDQWKISKICSYSNNRSNFNWENIHKNMHGTYKIRVGIGNDSEYFQWIAK